MSTMSSVADRQTGAPMALEHLQLVSGLRHAGLSTNKVRNRFTLWAIAFTCDGLGRCRASFATLAQMTGIHGDLISIAVHELAEDGVLILEPGAAGRANVRLNMARLKEMQEAALLKAEDDIRQLAAHGVGPRALSALAREYTTVGAVLKPYDDYCALPPECRTGFHKHLLVRNLGAEGGQQLVEALEEILRLGRGARGR